MAYIEYMITPVPANRLKDYQALAKKSAKVWKKHGALSYYECVADNVKSGKNTSFPQSVKLKQGEVVAACHIVFRSKAHHDAVWKRVMKDPFMANFDMKTAPFDGARMFFGGFKSVASF